MEFQFVVFNFNEIQIYFLHNSYLIELGFLSIFILIFRHQAVSFFSNLVTTVQHPLSLDTFYPHLLRIQLNQFSNVKFVSIGAFLLHHFSSYIFYIYFFFDNEIQSFWNHSFLLRMFILVFVLFGTYLWKRMYSRRLINKNIYDKM